MSATADLRALRFAATLAEVAPSIRLRLRHGGRAVLRVARRDEEPWSEVPCCHPDAFRAGVARGYRARLVGAPTGVLEVLAGTPAIDVGLEPGDEALPGGIFRLRTDDQHLHLFLTTLPPSACQRALDASLGDHVVDGPAVELACGSWGPVGLHWDACTEVTVVHTFAHVDDVDGAHAAMTRLLEVVAVAEALAELGVGALDGPSETRT